MASETSEIDPRVLRGAHFLDVRRPGWDERIDLDTFDLGNACDCVVGQTEGDYQDGAKTLGLEPYGDEAREFGFVVGPKRPLDDWDVLGTSWRSLIESRRAS